jgi:hypothetical protein
MPANKDLKRVVRARMKKTGESYTAARSQLLKKPRAKRPVPEATPAPRPGDYAKLAGMSDAAVKAKTGCTWERWVVALDHHGAAKMSHREIAALVHEKYDVSGWWAQQVTVGYERIRGLRDRGQRRDGAYEAGKSRTFNVPVEALFDAFANSAKRRRWLDGEKPTVRTATAPRSMRLGWPDGTLVALWFEKKGAEKSSVSVQHTKLPDRSSVERMKTYWSARLDRLAEVLRG